MGIDVYTLASEYPDTVIQLKVSDLVEAARVFAKDLAIELTMEIEKEENESVVPNFPQSLLTKREVMKLLGVGETTLWRWATQYDYLRPVMIGGERRWKRKDIEAIMEGNVVNYNEKPIVSRKKYTVKDKGNM